MLSCSEATRLIASEDFRSASLMRRLGLRMHVAMCRYCSRYSRHLQSLARHAREVNYDLPEQAIRGAVNRMVRSLVYK